jgi:hypothetical protein
MPRDALGVVTLPVGNPVVAGTAISADVANATTADLASMIEDSLSRSGKGGMNAPMQFADGAVATPSITFSSGTNAGFFYTTLGGLLGVGVSIAGSLQAFFTAALSIFYKPVQMNSTLDVTGNTTIGGNLTVTGTITNSGGTIASAKAFILIDAAGTCVLYGARNVASATWNTSVLTVTFTTPMSNAYYFASATQYGVGPGEFNTTVGVIAAAGVGFQKDVAGVTTDWAVGEYVQVFATE